MTDCGSLVSAKEIGWERAFQMNTVTQADCRSQYEALKKAVKQRDAGEGE